MMFIQIKNTFWGYFTELHTNDLCTFCLCISLQFKNKTAASSCLRPFTSESLGVKPWQGHFQECTQGWRHCPSPLLLCSLQEGRPMAVCLGAYHVCLRAVGRTLPSGEKKVGGSCVQMTDSKNGPLGVRTRLLTCSDWRPTKNTSLQGLPAATLPYEVIPEFNFKFAIEEQFLHLFIIFICLSHCGDFCLFICIFVT